MPSPGCRLAYYQIAFTAEYVPVSLVSANSIKDYQNISAAQITDRAHTAES